MPKQRGNTTTRKCKKCKKPITVTLRNGISVSGVCAKCRVSTKVKRIYSGNTTMKKQLRASSVKKLSQKIKTKQIKKLKKQVIKNKEELAKQKRMKKCAACGSTVKIQWHHALQYGGRSLQEHYAIIALCEECHMGNSMKPTLYARVISELLAITMGLADLQNKYPKFDWLQRKIYLTQSLCFIRDTPRQKNKSER